MNDTEELRNLKGIHMSHLNGKSLVNKWDNVKANFLNSGIHILTFSEIWLHSQLPDNLNYSENGGQLVARTRELARTILDFNYQKDKCR